MLGHQFGNMSIELGGVGLAAAVIKTAGSGGIDLSSPGIRYGFLLLALLLCCGGGFLGASFTGDLSWQALATTMVVVGGAGLGAVAENAISDRKDGSSEDRSDTKKNESTGNTKSTSTYDPLRPAFFPPPEEDEEDEDSGKPSPVDSTQSGECLTSVEWREGDGWKCPKCEAMCLDGSKKCSKCGTLKPEKKPPPDSSEDEPGAGTLGPEKKPPPDSSEEEPGARRLASLDGVPLATAPSQAIALATGAPLLLNPLVILPLVVVIYLLVRCIQGALAKRRREWIRAALSEMELDRLVEIVIEDRSNGCTKVGRVSQIGVLLS